LYALGCIKDAQKIEAKEKYKKLFLDHKVPRRIANMMESLSLRTPYYDPEALPEISFFLHVEFTLDKPYLSRDDEAFYVHENPIAKEKVFKVPYIRASSWKGNLRWSALKNLVSKISGITEKEKKREIAFHRRARIVRIFGNEKENRENSLFEEIFPDKIQEKGRIVSNFNQIFLQHIIKHNYVNKDGNGKGRLSCYPTFFSKIGLDVINPHDRKTRTGKNPITLEVVPKDTKGDLYLLYVPFDKIGENENETKNEIEEDLLMICNAIKALLTEYGISAKRTSGYGAADIGRIEFKSELLKKYERHTDLDGLTGELNNGGIT
jgi:CRISPR-associated protein Cmr2